MRPDELLRRLRRLARSRGWEFEVGEGAGHSKITLNGFRTVIPRHRRDLKAGTLRAILRQLDLSPTDLEG